MVGIVLVTHGNLATELMQVCQGIAGECRSVSVVTFSSNEAKQQLSGKVEQTIQAAEQGAGVLVLVDSIGGSPSNICLGMYAKSFPIEVVCGVNLAMVLEAVYNCNKYPLHELAKRVEEAGKKSIVNATDLYRAKLQSKS